MNPHKIATSIFNTLPNFDFPCYLLDYFLGFFFAIAIPLCLIFLAPHPSNIPIPPYPLVPIFQPQPQPICPIPQIWVPQAHTHYSTSTFTTQTSQASPPPYLKVAMTWIPTFCLQQRKTCNIHPVPSLFSAHGLWPMTPSISGGPSRPFISTFDPPIGLSSPDLDYVKFGSPSGHMYTLGQYWENFDLYKHTFLLWKHEYNNHGICMYQSLHDYLSVSLTLMRRLVDQYHINSVVTPGQVMFSSVLRQNIATALGLPVNINIVCVQGGVLYEIQICFEKDPPYNLINCAGNTWVACSGHVIDIPR